MIKIFPVIFRFFNAIAFFKYAKCFDADHLAIYSTQKHPANYFGKYTYFFEFY